MSVHLPKCLCLYVLCYGAVLPVHGAEVVRLVPYLPSAGQTLEIEEVATVAVEGKANLKSNLHLDAPPSAGTSSSNQKTIRKISIISVGNDGTPSAIRVEYLTAEGVDVSSGLPSANTTVLKGRVFKVSTQRGPLLVESQDASAVTDAERILVRRDCANLFNWFTLKSLAPGLVFTLDAPVKLSTRVANAILGNLSGSGDKISEVTVKLAEVRPGTTRQFVLVLSFTIQSLVSDTLKPGLNKAVSMPANGQLVISEDCKSIRVDVGSSVATSERLGSTKSTVDGSGSLRITIDREIRTP